MAKKPTPPDFSLPNRIELDYERLIAKLIGRYIPDKTTPDNVLRAFANLANNSEVLENLARPLAARMVTQLKAVNARSWREAAAQSSRGREIYEALQHEMETGVGTRVRELVAENAKLISSIPATMREEVDHEIARLQLQGLRPEVVADYLRKRLPQITRTKAALIARTETGKAATALTQARSEDIGIHWYQWISVKDQRVRPSHRLMDHVLVNWNDPPSPEKLAGIRSTLGHYAPGGAPNCRCDALPVTSLDVVSWPARVYGAGSIRRMTRGQFATLAGMKQAA